VQPPDETGDERRRLKEKRVQEFVTVTPLQPVQQLEHFPMTMRRLLETRHCAATGMLQFGTMDDHPIFRRGRHAFVKRQRNGMPLKDDHVDSKPRPCKQAGHTIGRMLHTADVRGIP